MLRGRCTYWPKVGNDSFGQPTFGTPVQLKCRWEDCVKQIMTHDGRTVSSQARIYLESDVSPGGVLLQVLLENVADLSVPFNNEGAWEIMRFDKLPTLRYSQFLRTAWV